MTFSVKNWIDETDPLGPPADPASNTPIDGTSLEDLETRLSAYSDTAVAAAISSGATAGQVGITGPSGGGWFVSTITAAANTAYAVRIAPRRNMTIVKIRFVTTLAATSNDACDVGIYSADLATKIVSAGATSAIMNATAGPQSITVASTPLVAGTTYYLAFSYGAVGGTAAKLAMADYNGLTNAAGLYGNTAGQRETFTKAASHPLPSSLTSALITATQLPVLAACES